MCVLIWILLSTPLSAHVSNVPYDSSFFYVKLQESHIRKIIVNGIPTFWFRQIETRIPSDRVKTTNDPIAFWFEFLGQFRKCMAHSRYQQTCYGSFF